MRTLINLHLVRICVPHADISLVLRKNHAFSFKLFKRNSTKNQNEIIRNFSIMFRCNTSTNK